MQITIPSLLRIKPNAIYKLGKYLRNESLKNIVIFWGDGLQEKFSEIVKVSFESSEIKVLQEGTAASIEIEKIFEIGTKLPNKTQAIVAIGGGKVIDFCKYMAFMNQLPIVSVPTAISNDGFGSPMSSLVIEGKRKTVKTKIPYGIIIDTEIIKKSPEKFLYSGIGDLICKATSIYDWKLAFKKVGEPVNDFASTMTKSAFDAFAYYGDKRLDNLEYIRIMASSLLMSGIAMEIAGSSRPASGSEHLISHAYDKISKNPSMHGIQVGVATFAVSHLQKENFYLVKNLIQETGFYDFVTKNKLNKNEFIEAIKFAPTVKENFYTVLSEKDNLQKLIKFVEENEMMKDMLA